MSHRPTARRAMVLPPPPPISSHPAFRSSSPTSSQIEVLEIPQPPPHYYDINFRDSSITSTTAPVRKQRSIGFILSSAATSGSRPQSDKRSNSSSIYTSRRRQSSSTSAASTYRRRSSACSYNSFASLQRCQGRQTERVDPSLEKAGFCYSIQNTIMDSSGSSIDSGDEKEPSSSPRGDHPSPTAQLKSFFGRKLNRQNSDNSTKSNHRKILGDLLGRR